MLQEKRKKLLVLKEAFGHVGGQVKHIALEVSQILKCDWLPEPASFR